MPEIPGSINGQGKAGGADGPVTNHEFAAQLRPVTIGKFIGSPALQPIGRDLLNGAAGFPAGMVTKLATDAVGQDLARFGAAYLPTLSAAAWISPFNLGPDPASIYRDSVAATLTSVRSDLASAGLAATRSLQGVSTASTIAVDTMGLGLTSWRQSLTEAVAANSPLDALARAASATAEMTVASLGGVGHLWDDVSDAASRLIGSTAWSMAGSFDSLAWVREALDHATIPNIAAEWFRPESGSVRADLYLLEDREANSDERLAAVRRMADRMTWYPRTRAVRRALAEQAEAENTTVSQIRHRELCAAVLLVLDHKRRPQTHRVGKDWITGDDGRKVAVAPTQLPMDLFWDWLYREVPKAAEASLLGLPYPPASDDPMDRDKDGVRLCLSLEAGSHDPADPDGDPLLALLEAERRAEHWARLLPALQVATPGQIQLLVLLAAGLTKAEAARRLGIAPGTARSQLARLRRRVV